MEYGRIIKRALHITWHYKVLWVIGIVAALFGGASVPNGNGGGQGFRYTLNDSDIDRLRRSMPGGMWGGYGRGPEILAQAAPFVAIALLVLLGVAIISLIVRIIVRYTTQGALIGMVDEIENTEKTSLRSGLKTGWGRLLRLFAINLLVGVASLILALIVMIVFVIACGIVALPFVLLVGTAASGAWPVLVVAGILAGIGVVALLVLMFIVLSALTTFVEEYAFRACVLQTEGVFDSIKVAFATIKAHLRETVVVWLLLAAIELALGLLSIPVALLALGTIVVPGLLAGGLASSGVVGVLVAMPPLLLWVLVALWFSGLYTVFRSAVWTLTYRELLSMPGADAETYAGA